MAPLLEMHEAHAFYGQSHVLHGVSLELEAGKVVALLGRNGAGKTTIVLTLMGYLAPMPGSISFRGKDISRLRPHRRAALGFGFVPQERGIFPSLSVRENLTTFARPGRWTLAEIFALFPRLAERQGNWGFQLSGGEQQMLAIGRALMRNPALLLLDEPSEGLAPLIVAEIIAAVRRLRQEGLAILLVEQNLAAALAVADCHHVVSKGAVMFTGSSAELTGQEAVLKQYLSV